MKTVINVRLPYTALCRVVYSRGGVNYSAQLPTPSRAAGLQVPLLARGVAMRQVVRVEPVRNYARH